jgi:hypothetical protein
VSEYVRTGNAGRRHSQFPTILGSNCITEVSAFGNVGEFGFFYVPPNFHYETGLTLEEYLLTLDSNTLFNQPPEEEEREFELPEEIGRIIEILRDDDMVEFVRCPDTDRVIFNIIVNESNRECDDCCRAKKGILTRIADAITGIPQAFGNVLASLFVPSPDYFADKFEGFQQGVDDKIPILSQIQELMNTLFLQFGNMPQEPPEFTIELYGQRVNMIDFSMFAMIRPFVHGIIVFFAWFHFIRRLVRRIPKALGGIEK